MNLGSRDKNKGRIRRKQNRRLTEREEDEILEHELSEEEDDIVSSANYLTTQPSIMTGGILRDYQLEGLNWMIRLFHSKISGMLADEVRQRN